MHNPIIIIFNIESYQYINDYFIDYIILFDLFNLLLAYKFLNDSQ
jgi:hypothetical protein